MTCQTPIKVKTGSKFTIVPCGQCFICKHLRASDWSTRLWMESLYHEHMSFITLTYNEEHCTGTVSKRHIQLFLKRLRKSVSNVKVRYFICAEYGPNTHRPHYHGILFSNKKLFKDTIEESWQNGFVSAQRPRSKSSVANYCGAYCNKPEVIFRMQSTGLGRDYALDPKYIKYHKPNDNPEMWKRYAILPNTQGVKKRLPRYIKDKIFTKEENAAYQQTEFMRSMHIKTYTQYVTPLKDKLERRNQIIQNIHGKRLISTPPTLLDTDYLNHLICLSLETQSQEPLPVLSLVLQELSEVPR